MSDVENAILEAEWTHLFDVDELSGGHTKLTISPDEDAAKRLAQRLSLVSIDNLKADITISRGAREVAYHVRGGISAKITQECVVTLEPVYTDINESFEAWFADPEAAVSLTKLRHEKENLKGHGEIPMLEESDDPEPLVNGKIDLGELVTQYLSLSIDPYPHAEGVEFEQKTAGKSTDEDDDAIKNPFAALKDWKDKLTNKE